MKRPLVAVPTLGDMVALLEALAVEVSELRAAIAPDLAQRAAVQTSLGRDQV